MLSNSLSSFSVFNFTIGKKKRGRGEGEGEKERKKFSISSAYHSEMLWELTNSILRTLRGFWKPNVGHFPKLHASSLAHIPMGLHSAWDVKRFILQCPPSASLTCKFSKKDLLKECQGNLIEERKLKETSYSVINRLIPLIISQTCARNSASLWECKAKWGRALASGSLWTHRRGRKTSLWTGTVLKVRLGAIRVHWGHT